MRHDEKNIPKEGNLRVFLCYVIYNKYYYIRIFFKGWRHLLVVFYLYSQQKNQIVFYCCYQVKSILYFLILSFQRISIQFQHLKGSYHIYFCWPCWTEQLTACIALQRRRKLIFYLRDPLIFNLRGRVGVVGVRREKMKQGGIREADKP